MGLFDKLKQGLKKTRNLLKTDVRDLFKTEGQLVDEAFLDKLRAILFKTDMGYEAVEEIVAEVAKNFRGRVVTLDPGARNLEGQALSPDGPGRRPDPLRRERADRDYGLAA